jgi:hypothetical protein
MASGDKCLPEEFMTGSGAAARRSLQRVGPGAAPGWPNRPAVRTTSRCPRSSRCRRRLTGSTRCTKGAVEAAALMMVWETA